ncbi:hypothetical protein BGW37DRAFT_470854 [Umbelopsis sp. PMI_123]|nr:hypothetical protein BGW37DRAFT_470854 [Umbelopsis sp. PMI_123]
MVDLLIKQEADVNLADRNGKTALHLAVKKGNVELVKKLLDGGAITKATYYSQDSPMDIAIENRNAEMVALLINKAGKFSSKYSYHQIQTIIPNLPTTLSYAEEKEKRKTLKVQTTNAPTLNIQKLEQQHQSMFDVYPSVKTVTTIYGKALAVHVGITDVLDGLKLKYPHGFLSTRTLDSEIPQNLNDTDPNGPYCQFAAQGPSDHSDSQQQTILSIFLTDQWMIGQPES